MNPYGVPTEEAGIPRTGRLPELVIERRRNSDGGCCRNGRPSSSYTQGPSSPARKHNRQQEQPLPRRIWHLQRTSPVRSNAGGASPLQGSPYPADFAKNARTLPPGRCRLTVIADQLATVAELGRAPGNDPVTGARDEDRSVAELFPLEVNQNRAAVRQPRLNGRPHGARRAAMPRLKRMLAQPPLAEVARTVSSQFRVPLPVVARSFRTATGLPWSPGILTASVPYSWAQIAVASRSALVRGNSSGESSRPSARRTVTTSESCSRERPCMRSSPKIRCVSRLVASTASALASTTATPTAEVSIRASRFARARCCSRRTPPARPRLRS